MSWFADLPFQRKMGYAMLVTSTVALVLACVVFLAVEFIGYRRNLVHTVETLARITADNSTAAIAFSDRISARQTLEALRAEPQVMSATLFDAEGHIFARYVALPEAVRPIEPTAPAGTRVENGRVVVVEPVVENTRRLGTLHVQATMDRIYERMQTYAVVVLGVLASSFGLAGLIASALRRSLARPILELANTSRTIAARQDYSLRARQYGRDELGQLTATFNAMLARIEVSVDKLRESEWAHRELVRSLPTAAYMCDSAGLITIFNEAAVVLWGRTPEIGREYWCGSYRIHRADGSPLPLDQCPMAVSLREGRPVRGTEIIIERPDGSRRNVLPHPEPIRDTAGTLVGIVNMLVDITEQKQADAAVRRLAAIVESSDDAIIGKDLEGFVTSWNRGAEILYGYTADEIIGRPISVLIPRGREHEEPVMSADAASIDQVEHFETVRRRKDGAMIDVSLTISPIKNAEGRIVGSSKIARNITARKRAAAQDNFLGQLSQHLTPLADPDEIIRAAAAMIGHQLEADRCYFCTVDADGSRVAVLDDWAREGRPTLKGVYAAADFGTPEMWQAMAAGPLGVDDKVTHPLAANRGSGYDRLGIRSHATAPFRRDGRWIASLAVTAGEPRTWREDELDLLENALDRVWPMVERAQSQRELQESERRQRTLMRALPVACFTVDRGGRLTFFNDAAVQLWGRVPVLGEAYGHAAHQMTTIQGLPIPPEQSPVAVALREKRPVRGAEALVIRPDGTRRWVVPHPDPIFDAQGNCTGVVNVVMDVTEERTAHERIQAVADRLSLAIASANLGDWNWDAATDLLSLSPRTCEIYGVPAGSQLTRTAMREILHEDDRQRALEELQRAVGQRSDYDIEYRVNRRDGKQCWVAAKGRSFYGTDGRIAGMVGVAQDITDRKQAEIELKRARDEALEASRAKDDFLAALSHELRTPLNPVLLLASDAAHNPELPAAIRADFELIRKNVDLEARLIDDLLDLTRITRGKAQLEQQPCDVHAILQDAINNVRPDLSEKRLVLSVDMAATEPRVLGDAVRLQQAFWNILKNAVKFTPSDGQISVTTRDLADPKRVMVAVTDTGIGMTPEEIDRAFLAFSQGDHAASGSHLHRFGGLGLGLAITKMLVDLHAGRIVAASEGRDHGSTFVVELPVMPRSTNPAGSPVRAAAGRSAKRSADKGSGPKPAAPRRRILLVEDHAPTRTTLQHLLGNRNFEVTAAESATRAHQLARETDFDIVISDVGLPDRNGYQLMAELRILNPRLAGIALSGYGMEEDLDRSRAAGFSSHLVKPVTIGMLEDAIASLTPAVTDGNGMARKPGRPMP